MTITAKKLVSAQQLTNSAATYYTATNVRTIIDKMTLTNTTGGAETVTVYLVDASGTAGASECIISAHSIGAGETYICPEVVGHILNPSDFLQALASSNSAITIRVSGREVA